MTADLAHQAEAFCEASIRDWTGRAARMLAATPEIAGYNFATAVILGDADRVRAEIGRDPGLATWNSTPIEWAAVGSGGQPAGHPHSDWPVPDWTATVQALLEAGASTGDITLSPDNPKPPSPEVATLLRREGQVL